MDEHSENGNDLLKLTEKIQSFKTNFEALNDIPDWGKSLFGNVAEILNEINVAIELIFAENRRQQELLRSKVSIQSTVIDTLCCEKTRLNQAVNKLEDQVDEQSNYTRRNQLLIHGLDEEHGEDTTRKVLQLFSDNLNINDVSEKDIDRSHRIGKRDVSRNTRNRKAKIRPIIVKFISYQDRKNVSTLRSV